MHRTALHATADVECSLSKFATIVPQDGAENAFIVTDMKGKSETVDLAKGINTFSLSKLRTEPRLRLTASDGESLAVDRSGHVTFITSGQQKQTYVVH